MGSSTGSSMSQAYDERRILAPLAVKSRDELFHLAARAIAEIDDLDEKEVYEGFYARESMMTTMIAPGVALPHAQFEGLGKTSGVIAVMPSGCDFGSGLRAKVAAFLVDDPADQAGHMETLRKFALVAKNPRFLEKICAATTPAQARGVIERMELTA